MAQKNAGVTFSVKMKNYVFRCGGKSCASEQMSELYGKRGGVDVYVTINI